MPGPGGKGGDGRPDQCPQHTSDAPHQDDRLRLNARMRIGVGLGACGRAESKANQSADQHVASADRRPPHAGIAPAPIRRRRPVRGRTGHVPGKLSEGSVVVGSLASVIFAPASWFVGRVLAAGGGDGVIRGICRLQFLSLRRSGRCESEQ